MVYVCHLYFYIGLHSNLDLSVISSFSHFPLSFGLTSLVLSGVSLVDLVIKPHVSHGHAVLRQRARLV